MKTLIQGMLIATCIFNSMIEANPQAIAKLCAFAAKNYGFISQYPIKIVRDLLKREGSIACAIDLPAFKEDDDDLPTEIPPVAKNLAPGFIKYAWIQFDEEFFMKLLKRGDLKTLLALTIHEHEHLEKNHCDAYARAQSKLKYDLNIHPKVYNKPLTPEELEEALKLDQLFEDGMRKIARKQEEEADAAVRPYPDLCLRISKLHLKWGKEEVKTLYKKYFNEKDSEAKLGLKIELRILRSNNPTLIELIEDETHPHSLRRALYYKQWAKEGNVKSDQD